MNHEFINLDFLGTPKQACKFCACLHDSPQAKDECKAAATDDSEAMPVMARTPAKTTQKSPVDFLHSLDVGTITAKIAELEGEVAAWKVLLKAMKAKDKVTHGVE